MKPNILIFAGAGASMAVNAEQFPTTLEFFKRLPEEITSYELFRQLVVFLQQQSGLETVDIEQILWAVDDLRRDLRGLEISSSVIGYCLEKGNVSKSLGPIRYGDFPQAIRGLLSQAQWLWSEINKLVYDLYSYDPSESELSSNWVPLLKPLWALSNELNIFTTNYDGVIESALAAMGLSGEELDSYLGLGGARKKFVNLDAWKDVPVDGKGLLTKLHGSVDWKRHGNRINISDAAFSGNHEQHPIIYPGFKGAASTDFFGVFHSYLDDCVRAADIIVFIGFAFRDEHINSIVRDGIKESSDVILVDPNSKVRFCSNRVTPFRVKSFDEKGLGSIYPRVQRLASSKKRKIQLV